MKKQSFITIAAKWMLVALLVSLMSVTTTWVVVNWHVQQVFQAFPMLAEWSQGSLPQPTTEVTADEESALEDQEEKQASELDKDMVDEGSSRLEQLVNQWLEQDGRGLQEGEAEDGSVPVWSGEQSQAAVLTMDDLLQMRDELSDDDKMTLFSLAGTKVPLQELQALSEWMENGLTMEEIIQIEDMFMQYLSDQEVEQMLQIAENYLE